MTVRTCIQCDRHADRRGRLGLGPPTILQSTMVGGSGEKKTPRLVAKYAQACNSEGPSALRASSAVRRSR
jgi:hypothetical protein